MLLACSRHVISPSPWRSCVCVCVCVVVKSSFVCPLKKEYFTYFIYFLMEDFFTFIFSSFTEE